MMLLAQRPSIPAGPLFFRWRRLSAFGSGQFGQKITCFPQVPEAGVLGGARLASKRGSIRAVTHRAGNRAVRLSAWGMVAQKVTE